MSDLTRQQLCAFWPAGICTERQEITPRLHWGSVSVFKPAPQSMQINHLPPARLDGMLNRVTILCGLRECS